MGERMALVNSYSDLTMNGGGPWRILPECPRPTTHNTANAAEGKFSSGAGGIKCICPQGLYLYETVILARRERERERMKRVHKRTADPRVRLTPVTPNPVSRRSPNFLTAACRTPAGLRIADQGANDQATLAGIAARELAKKQCRDECPLLVRCAMWVTSQESPAGSWGGVWGGLDPWNRKGLELIITGGRAEVIPL